MRYDINWDKETKVNYFLRLLEENKVDWHNSYGEIFFLLDLCKVKREYIGWKLYKPMCDLFDKIDCEKRQLARYSDIIEQISECEQKESMNEFEIKWLESLRRKQSTVAFSSIRNIETILTRERFECTNSTVGAIHCTDCTSFARMYFDEFNGRYYKIMYGKKRDKERDC